MDKCSFCGRTKKETNMLIAGLEGHICDHCIEQANAIMNEELVSKKEVFFDPVKLLKPTEIKDFLDPRTASSRIACSGRLNRA